MTRMAFRCRVCAATIATMPATGRGLAVRADLAFAANLPRRTLVVVCDCGAVATHAIPRRCEIVGSSGFPVAVA